MKLPDLQHDSGLLVSQILPGEFQSQPSSDNYDPTRSQQSLGSAWVDCQRFHAPLEKWQGDTPLEVKCAYDTCNFYTTGLGIVETLEATNFICRSFKGTAVYPSGYIKPHGLIYGDDLEKVLLLNWCDLEHPAIRFQGSTKASSCGYNE